MTTPHRTTRPATVASAWLVLSVAASCVTAQDIPHIDAVGAYNHANVMTRPSEPPREGPATLPQDPGKAISQEQLDEILNTLSDGYQARVRRDGKSSADEWLERRVDELRKQYTSIK